MRAEAMKKAAISSASENLERAKTALDEINGALSLSDLESAWSAFLVAASRVYTKLEQGAKSNGTSGAWFGRKKTERKNDKTLQYAHHARNADEHGLAKVTDRTSPALALGVGPGRWRFDGTTGPGGQLQITALGGQTSESKFVDAIPSKVRLVKVVDRGVSYDPPQDQNGRDLLPNEVAESVVKALDALIKEAEQLPAT
jgi:hypothetical protein